MSDLKKHYRTCNICEAMCGLEITYKGNQIHSIKGDKNDPLSEGHICPKAYALQDVYYDKDRLKSPIRKTENGWKAITWEEAYQEIEEKILNIQAEFGNDAIASYLGNPNAHDHGNALFLPIFLRALGTKNKYSSASADQLPHHVAAKLMFGHGMLIPIPDIDRTDFMIIIGGNPLVSNGSMMTSPNFSKRMKNIQKRGGKIVVIDPRKTETAKKADQHFFIQPESDALLLLAMIKTVIDEKLVDFKHLEKTVIDFEVIEKIAQDFSPKRVAAHVGILADEIKNLAIDFANSPSAVCYSRMGASTQSFGGLCQWLTNVLNIITGNYDCPGGAMFTEPAFDLVKMTSRKNNGKPPIKYRSRVRKLPYFNGEFPISTLADEIITAGEGQIKALICIAGNPVLSSPNGERLAQAFEQLEFMVAVDIYLNETTRHADLILPAATGLEVPHYDIFFNSFSVKNIVKYSPALFEKDESVKYDWEILRKLTSIVTRQPESNLTPEMILDNGFKSGQYGSKGLSLEKLKSNPHGIDLGPLNSCLSERLTTDDKTIQLAPPLFVDDLERLKNTFFTTNDHKKSFPLRMIGRRRLRSHNTWLHNSYRMMKGRNECTLFLHPNDAHSHGLKNGHQVMVSSRIGSVKIEVEVTDEIMEGVVCIPQGFGHGKKGTQMDIANQHPGVSINDLTDHERVDVVTGNAAFNGIEVRLEKVGS